VVLLAFLALMFNDQAKDLLVGVGDRFNQTGIFILAVISHLRLIVKNKIELQFINC